MDCAIRGPDLRSYLTKNERLKQISGKAPIWRSCTPWEIVLSNKGRSTMTPKEPV